MSRKTEFKPCKRGHGIEHRYLDNRGYKICRMCQAGYSQKWEQANRLHRRRYHRLYAYVRRGILERSALLKKPQDEAR